MGCLKLDIEYTHTGLKVSGKSGQVVYGSAVNVSRGSGKNGVEANFYCFGEQEHKSQVNLAFSRRETEQSQSPIFDKVESQHFGVSTKCLCGKKYYDPRISQWLSVDPLASKMPLASPYNYVLGNPIRLIDPNGMNAVCPDCSDTPEYEEAINSPDFYSYDSETGYAIKEQQLPEVAITTQAPYKSSLAYMMFGELASGKNLSSDNPYLPPQAPDAVSLQVNVSASGIFSEDSFSGGLAFSRNEAGIFGSASAGAGVSDPGIGLSVQLNFHYKTPGGNTSLNNIGGTDAGGSVGLGLIGSYSRSIEVKGGAITPITGFHTYSTGAGLGGGLPFGTRGSISTTKYIPIIK